MTDTFRGIAHGFVETSGPCNVTPRGQGIEVNDDAGKIIGVNLPYLALSVQLTGMDDAYIEFRAPLEGKTVKVLVSDKSIVRQIEAIGAPRLFIDALHALLAKRSKRALGRFAVPVILLMLLAGIVFGVWGLLGYATQKAVDYIPPDWEKSLGKAAAQDVLNNNKICSDPELMRAVNEMGTRLVGGLGSSRFNFTLRVVDTEEVNAFALPGGYLFINRGLIEQADDSFEVAGVLAHEIEHVMLRHGMHNMARQAGTMLLLRAFVGDFGGVEQFMLYNAASLAAMSFSRDQERAADLGGIDLMYRAGMDPTGLSRFLQKLAKEEGTMSNALSILSTHPASKDRVEELNAVIARRPVPDVVPLSTDIKNVKNRCAPIEMTDPDGDI